MLEVDNEIIERSIRCYGITAQSVVCMEECSELIQCVSKMIRGGEDKYHLTEEMADVLISIELLKQMYDVSDEELQELVLKKQERLGRRCTQLKELGLSRESK